METAVSSETVVQSYIPEGTAQLGVEFWYGQLYTYVQVSPV